MSEWSPWTDCSTSCGTGMQARYRHIKQNPSDGGRACPSLDASSKVHVMSIHWPINNPFVKEFEMMFGPIGILVRNLHEIIMHKIIWANQLLNCFLCEQAILCFFHIFQRIRPHFMHSVDMFLNFLIYESSTFTFLSKAFYRFIVVWRILQSWGQNLTFVYCSIKLSFVLHYFWRPVIQQT